jgi:dTDP-glucose 4,6-dehydratase
MSTKKHVLITGGSGFIGSHLCDEFLKRGYAVTAVDNFISGRKENVAHLIHESDFELVDWDVCRPIPEARLKLLSRYGLQGVLHFACPASPVDFERIPFEILAVDSVGTMETVALALKYDCRYLLASTSEIYGDPQVHPQPESYFGNVNTVGPRSCYDETKRFAEAYVSTASRLGKSGKRLNAGIARIFNTYGPRMRADDGRIVPELCNQALQNRDLTLHGDGTQTRSFCYVGDLVDGIIRLFESDLKEPVNLGNPIERTMREFAEVIQKLSGTHSKVSYTSPRPDDPKRRCPDISRAKSKLGWTPQVSLEEGLSSCLEYFKKLRKT